MSNHRFLNFTFQISLVCYILVLSGCEISKGVRSMMSKKVKPQHYSFENKSIIFTPLVHFGQREFYDHLRDSIVDWKNDGYIIFYEQVGSGQSFLKLDSIAYDRLKRKFRRIDGGMSGTADDYAEELQTVFKKGIAQPKYADLGIDSTDINADVTLLDLVNNIEEYYGEITLDSCDYATHLDSAYTCFKGLKMKKLDPVYVDYRNNMVVDRITDTELEKIVVLYGAAHIKGMKKLLKEKQADNKKN